MEAERKMSKGGRTKWSKAQREEVKERVRLELLSQATHLLLLRYLLGPAQKWLLLGALASKPANEFEDLFKRCFQIPLTPFLPWDPEVLDASLARKVKTIPKGAFMAPQEKGEPSDDLRFLGREFLTWLWFKSEERGGAVRVANLGDLQVAFIRRLASSPATASIPKVSYVRACTPISRKGKRRSAWERKSKRLGFNSRKIRTSGNSP